MMIVLNRVIHSYIRIDRAEIVLISYDYTNQKTGGPERDFVFRVHIKDTV